jgi:hypothetical protein
MDLRSVLRVTEFVWPRLPVSQQSQERRPVMIKGDFHQKNDPHAFVISRQVTPRGTGLLRSHAASLTLR